MPEIIIPALLGAINVAGVGIAIGGGFFFKTSAFVLNAILGAALYALSPKPTAASAGPSLVTARSSNAARKLIYGEARIGGTVAFLESTDSDKYLHVVILFAAHEVQSFDGIYLNDELLTLSGNDVISPAKYAGKVKVYPVTQGTVGNIPASLISDTSWTSSHVLQDQAYVYFRFEDDRDAFQGQLPNISAVIKGRLVYDTRTSLTAYSSNPAMCIRDYLLDGDYGVGVDSSDIDDTTFNAAANICDEDVDLDAGGKEPRYEMDGVVDTGVTLKTNLEAMLTSLNGSLYHTNGKWSLRAGAYISPSITLDEDDLAGPIILTTANNPVDKFNAVKGLFVSPDSDYQITNFPEITSATFETEDGDARKYADLNLPFTSSFARAQRIAKQVLYRSRQKITFSAKFKLSVFKFQIGDTVMINNARFGFSSKVFEVVSWTMTFTPDDVSVTCVLKETNSAIYDWDESTEESVFQQDNTTLPDPSTSPTPTNLALAASSTVNADGVVNSIITATWDDVLTGFADHYEVQHKLTSGAAYTSIDGKSEEHIIRALTSGSNYTVRVRTVNIFGVRSPWLTATQNAITDTTAPSVATSLTATGSWKGNLISWVNPTDNDFKEVEVWVHTSDVSGSASKAGSTGGTDFFHGGLANASKRYYWLKSIDFTGNTSVFTSSVNATTYEKLDEATQLIGTLRSASSGERVEINDNLIAVYDASVVRIKIGNLA